MILKPSRNNPMRPASAGIDKIEIRIHPAMIKRVDAFHRKGNNNSYIQLRAPDYSSYYCLELHAEYFDSFQSYFEQIVQCILQKIEEGILNNIANTSVFDLRGYLYTYFTKVFHISKIEFYFDFRESDMIINHKNKWFYKWNGETTYSSDYKKGDKSAICAYRRILSLIADNNKPLREINSMDFTKRIEFRLTPRTCKYLHPNNLRGDYQMIFSCFKTFLAKKWREFGDEVAQVPNWFILDYADYFRDMINTVWMGKIQNPANFLLKSPENPIPQYSARKNDVDRNFFARFTTQQDNIANP